MKTLTEEIKKNKRKGKNTTILKIKCHHGKRTFWHYVFFFFISIIGAILLVSFVIPFYKIKEELAHMKCALSQFVWGVNLICSVWFLYLLCLHSTIMTHFVLGHSVQMTDILMCNYNYSDIFINMYRLSHDKLGDISFIALGTVPQLSFIHCAHLCQLWYCPSGDKTDITSTIMWYLCLYIWILYRYSSFISLQSRYRVMWLEKENDVIIRLKLA